MKKSIAVITSILLILSVLFAFTGCATREESVFIGSWNATADLTELLSTVAEEDLGGESFESYTDEPITVDVIFNFEKDGTYSMRIDGETVTKAAQAFADALKKIVKAQLEEYLKGEGVTDVDEFIENAYNTTFDELYEKQGLEEKGKEKFTEGLSLESSEGKFIVKDGKLYTSYSVTEEPDMSEYIEFTIDSGKITFTNAIGEDENATALLPLVLERN